VDSTRKTALAVGVLFILTFLTSIGGVIAYGPVLSDPNYITGAGADGRVFFGAFLELMLILTNIGCAVVLFPLLKRTNEGLALGYVAARLVECTFILVGLLSVLAIVTVRQKAAGADTRVFLGAFLELFLIVTNIGCAVVLFPLLKRNNEGLALGYVAARLVECTFILIGLLSLLAIVTLRQGAASADAGSLVLIGKALHAIHDWTFLLGPGLTDGIGTGLILGYLMYQSGLVSRRMALFGVVGGPLLAASGIAVLLGVIPQFSPLQSLATIPEIVWEAFLGLWLTFKGFIRSPITSNYSRPAGVDGARAAAASAV
jgi:hypothetical protein